METCFWPEKLGFFEPPRISNVSIFEIKLEITISNNCCRFLIYCLLDGLIALKQLIFGLISSVGKGVRASSSQMFSLSLGFALPWSFVNEVKPSCPERKSR